jgi:hypothetical protein
MSNQVRVIDNISGTVLFQTSLEKLSEAYSFAAMMEEEGLDIRIDAPGLTETLIKSLGASDAEILEYKKNLTDELESHIDDYGCTICPPHPSK